MIGWPHRATPAIVIMFIDGWPQGPPRLYPFNFILYPFLHASNSPAITFMLLMVRMASERNDPFTISGNAW